MSIQVTVEGCRKFQPSPVYIAFTLPATIQMHNFWNLVGKERIAGKAHFLKDLAIVGGLLLLILIGAGNYAVRG